MKKYTLLISTFLTIGAGLNAQNITFETDTSNILGLGTNHGTSKFADVDGDGDQDLFISGNSPIIGPATAMYTNDGNGIFTQNSSSLTSLDNSSSAFADIDGDGDLDLVYTGTDFYLGFGVVSQTMIYKNDGAGLFTQVTAPGGVFVTSGLEGVHDGSVDFGDMDSDGDQDLLITGYTNQLGEDTTILYENDGAGGFTFVTNTPFYNAHNSLAKFIDIDGDNDLDVLLTGKEGGFGVRLLEFYKNDGNGNFTHYVVNIAGAEGVSHSAFDFSDVDGDNDLDILVTGETQSNQAFTALYLNDGAGDFSIASGTTFETLHSGDVQFNDIDTDGDEDVLLTGFDGTNYHSILYENNGNGIFSEVVNMPFVGSKDGSIDFADIDGDNDSDVIIIGTENAQNSIKTKIYLNNSQQFLSVENPLEDVLVSIYPNPVLNELFIELEGQEFISIDVIDFSGKVIQKITNDATKSINVSNLPQGIYVLNVFTKKGVITNKFIKQ